MTTGHPFSWTQDPSLSGVQDPGSSPKGRKIHLPAALEHATGLVLAQVGTRSPADGRHMGSCRSGGVPVPGLRLRSMGGDLVDGGVVGVQPAPVRRQHFQWAEALSLVAVNQL